MFLSLFPHMPYLLYLHCVTQKATFSKSAEKSVNRSDSFASFCTHTRLCVCSVLGINWLGGCHAFHPMVRSPFNPVFLLCHTSFLSAFGTADFRTQVHSLCECFVSTFMNAQPVVVKSVSPYFIESRIIYGALSRHNVVLPEQHTHNTHIPMSCLHNC